MGAKIAAQKLVSRSAAPSSAKIPSQSARSSPAAASLQQAIGNAATLRLFRAPLIQRQLTDESESEAEVGPEVDLPASAEADLAEESEDEKSEQEENDVGLALETSGSPGPTGPKKKKKPLKFRRKPHRTKSFSGRTGIFGGKRGKHLRNWGWSWGNVKTQRDPSTKHTREQVLTSADSAKAKTGDSEITAHGALGYYGEKIAGQVEVSNFEGSCGVSVITPTPTLAFNETSSLISSRTVTTGTLTYRFGDSSDPSSGPRGRILVERQDPTTGSWVTIHDTRWITTQGEWKTDSLNGKLSPNANYRVRVFAEYWKNTLSPGYQWGDGRTQVDYSLEIQQNTTARFAITKTKVGKSKVTKEAHKLRIRL